MSSCIDRVERVSSSGKYMICSENKKPCPWYRAAWCIPWDALKFIFRAIGKMLLMMEE